VQPALWTIFLVNRRSASESQAKERAPLPVRSVWVLICCVVLAGCTLVSKSVAEGPPSARPNVILIFVDDLGYGDLTSYGHPTIMTPHLDRMATEGMKFTNFYVAASVCTPSRAALLTGRYPIRTGLTSVIIPRRASETHGLAPSEITVAEVLKEQGYATAIIGKWHLGLLPKFHPLEQGFDYFYGLLFSNDDGPPLPLYRNHEVLEDPADQSTLTKRYTQEAVAFIRKNSDKPFFLYLPHTMPHYPQAASERFIGSSPRGLYGDTVQELDWSAGEILKAVRETGMEDRTLVIFTSDNGPTPLMKRDGGSAGLLRGAKATTWEGGMRVPFIVRWPGRIPAGRVNQELVTSMDLFSTIIHLAGGKVPKDRMIDGMDVMKVFEGEGPSPREVFFYYFNDKICAVRQGKWKLHYQSRHPKIDPKTKKRTPSFKLFNPPELYNLDRDPSEKYVVTKEHPDVVKRLLALIRTFETSAL